MNLSICSGSRWVRTLQRFASKGLLGVWLAMLVSAEPLALNRQNPHYFEYEERATVLVTSGEHYGAVINQDFDYSRYLDELARNHLNLTRTWSGTYREQPGNFNIGDNTLAPRPQSFVSPWLRSDVPGALDGGNRFDLKRWNPAYFQRLHDFLRQAAQRKIIVEINLFCTFYEDSMWKASPLNAANNVNGAGNVPRSEVLSMQHRDLLAVEDEFVRKMVNEVNSFDNLYFEICNEPYWGKVQPEWQRHISALITETENRLPKKHLISENIANGSMRIVNPDPNISVFNFHYSRPPESVGLNYELDRVIGNNETGFDGQADATYRVQGWAFLAAGGALYNNLDYSFAVGHEAGDYQYGPKTPGGGSAALRRQLGVLARSFEELDLERLHPAGSLIGLESNDSTKMYGLAAPDEQYIAYLYRPKIESGQKPHFVLDEKTAASQVSLDLSSGNYEVIWLDPKTGSVLKHYVVKQTDRKRTLTSPAYSEDIVLKIQRQL